MASEASLHYCSSQHHQLDSLLSCFVLLLNLKNALKVVLPFHLYFCAYYFLNILMMILTFQILEVRYSCFHYELMVIDFEGLNAQLFCLKLHLRLGYLLAYFLILKMSVLNFLYLKLTVSSLPVLTKLR